MDFANDLADDDSGRLDSVGAMAFAQTPGTRLAVRALAAADCPLVDARRAPQWLQHF